MFASASGSPRQYANRPSSPRHLPGLDEKELPFTAEEEDDLIEWLIDNPPIYNHGSSNFKGRELKQDLITRQAQKMSCTYALLHTWIINFRNYYVKLMKMKSGQAADSLTDRQ